MQRVGTGGCENDADQEKDLAPVSSVQDPPEARFPAPVAKQCQPGGPPEIAPEKDAPRLYDSRETQRFAKTQVTWFGVTTYRVVVLPPTVTRAPFVAQVR